MKYLRKHQGKMPPGEILRLGLVTVMFAMSSVSSSASAVVILPGLAASQLVEELKGQVLISSQEASREPAGSSWLAIRRDRLGYVSLMTAAPIPPPHPRGIATLFFTEMWERMSYYGMRALLVLFMVDAVEHGGLGITPKMDVLGVPVVVVQ